MSTETSCYTVVSDDGSEVPSIQELRQALEKGTDEVKIDTLRRVVIAMLNGTQMVAIISYHATRQFQSSR
jgi:coatomer subunit beta